MRMKAPKGAQRGCYGRLDPSLAWQPVQ